MVSTYLGFQLYANNPAATRQRIENEGAVQTAQAYYDANIGKVKTVDDLLGNYRLFSYAMQAYGLSDMTYAKGLMRQVLTSDLSSSTSVANKLSDSRYRAIAAAFGFATDGTLAKTSIQSADQQADTVARFQSQTATTLSSATATAATAYYTAHIGSVTSLADLEKDQKLYSYVMTAFGVDTSTTSTATIENVLESDLSSPQSLINTTPGSGYLALSEAVNVTTTGAASTQTMDAQTQAQTTATVKAYAAAAGTDAASQTAAKAETTYFGSTISTITTVDGLLSDNRLVAYVTKAYNLPSYTSSSLLRQVLTSNVDDPTSVANRLSDPGFAALAQAFNFASNGALKTLPFQTDAQQQDTVALYTARQTSDTTDLETETAYYRAHIGAVTTVGGLQADTRLLSYVEKAYGLSTSTSTSTLQHVLEDDQSSSSALVNTTAGSNYLTLKQAFSVDGDGLAVEPLTAQDSTALSATTSAYAAKSETSAAAIRTETAYYTQAMADVTSVDGLLSDSRLVAYLKTAYGLSPTDTTARLRQVLTSDVTSSKSVANTLGDPYASLARAFQFGTNGLLATQAGQRAQSIDAQAATDAAYVQQTLEDEAGQQSTGVELALYFQRVAPTIKDGYSILADKALVQVFQTMLGLSSSSSNADIDSQARYLASKVNFSDLQDPTKVKQMVQRFAVMYDLANPSSDSSSDISLLFGSSSS